MSNRPESVETFPDVLVTTGWLASHLHDPSVRVMEANKDASLYFTGHISGAAHVDWTTRLTGRAERAYIPRAAFDALLSRIGATPDTTVVFYGDANNRWAAYGFWVFQLFAHSNVRILDGGRSRWISEGRPLTTQVLSFAPTRYRSAKGNDAPVRVFRDNVLLAIAAGSQAVAERSLDVPQAPQVMGQVIHASERFARPPSPGSRVQSAPPVPVECSDLEDERRPQGPDHDDRWSQSEGPALESDSRSWLDVCPGPASQA